VVHVHIPPRMCKIECTILYFDEYIKCIYIVSSVIKYSLINEQECFIRFTNSIDILRY
jgi:hypothetical protein